MIRTVVLTESTTQILELSPAEAQLLTAMGRALASDKTWWGEDDDEEKPRRSVISCISLAPTKYKVTVNDAIGVIGLSSLQLVVRPKIPLRHFVYLLEASGEVPRGCAERGSVESDEAFFELVIQWFVDAMERLLRLGLDRDYERNTASLPFAKGRIHAIATARSLLAGRPTIRCDYDVFGEDTSLNRVLKAAALYTLGAPRLPSELRRRARSICQRLDLAGPMRASDLRVVPDARTKHYCDSHQLALMILRSTGIRPSAGRQSVWTFLFRTPDAVEEGIRDALTRHLDPTWKVVKRGKRLLGSHKRTLQPDLVFGDEVAVGDVKYRVTNGEISRSHLNQATTFATGYNAVKAVVVGFGSVPVGEQVRVGNVRVDGMNWDITQDPKVAATGLATQINCWLAGLDK